MRASRTYLCSGMSRITPIAPKHSAASFAAASIASGAKACAMLASGSREAASAERLGMIRRPRGAPHRTPRDLEIHRDPASFAAIACAR